MTQDGGTELVALDGFECFALLAGHATGRLGVDVGRYPVILPVDYVLDGGDIVIRTPAGTTLAAAENENVTFEVDEVDPGRRTGWSVLVRGVAEELTGA